MQTHRTPDSRVPLGARPVYPLVTLVSVLLAAVLSLVVAPALALAVGQAASGELFFYPCDACHPVVLAADGTVVSELPVDFEGHQVALSAHAALGEGAEACQVCHEDPATDPGLLKTVDGGRVDVTGDVSLVCFGCHSQRFKEWQAGIHGREQEGCTAAGCHDPHTPEWIYGEALPPFTGTGFLVKVMSEREPFTPLAGPPVHPSVVTPAWLVFAAWAVALFSLGIIGFLVVGRRPR